MPYQGPQFNKRDTSKFKRIELPMQSPAEVRSIVEAAEIRRDIEFENELRALSDFDTKAK
jgi:hypothetical protein